ncbi:MAG: alpha/beta hydrolase-fold protein [Acidobacteriota bacterium]
MTDIFHTIEMSDPALEVDHLRSVTVKSPALGGRGDVTLWVPPSQQIATVLILLHGVYNSHGAWAHKGGVHRVAQTLLDVGEISPMVIAMPSDGLSRDGSAYLTFPDAQDVEKWVVDEVPAIARLAAPNLTSDANVSIGGFSMGGYGALRLGAKFPNRFHRVSAHSAITDIHEMEKFVAEPLSDYLACAPAEELSVLYWMRKHRDCLPHFRFDCGVDDLLIEGNRSLHRALEAEGIPHIYQEFAGGHEWPYWQNYVANTLRFVSQE